MKLKKRHYFTFIRIADSLKRIFTYFYYIKLHLNIFLFSDEKYQIYVRKVNNGLPNSICTLSLSFFLLSCISGTISVAKFGQGGAKNFLRALRANITRSARNLARFALEFLGPVFKIFGS
jgi:hypothetical protein